MTKDFVLPLWLDANQNKKLEHLAHEHWMSKAEWSIYVICSTMRRHPKGLRRSASDGRGNNGNRFR
jgi:hypothetical protein